MLRTEYLVDLLSDAAVEAPAENYVDLQRIVLGRVVETAIFQHPPSTITFPAVRIGKQAKLRFACGIKQVAWPLIKNGIRFTLNVQSATRREKLLDVTLHPRKRSSDRCWRKHEIDVSPFEGQSVQIVLQTRVGRFGSTEYAWAGWANPTIVHDVPGAPSARRDDRHPHIFLLTADALPARYLSCYGHPTVHTPHLDQLAADGVLFEQTWSQSCMTFGSYVSMLTGLHPHQHGVAREWQPFPVSHANLPDALREHGYHTLLALSSLELSGRTTCVDRIFAEVLSTLSNPMQDGAITNRQFIRAFERRPDQPCFAWIHHFDIHPPSIAPAPFDSMYYPHDPTAHEREYLADEIPKIRSVESALVMRAVMPLLERGQPVAEIIDILEDTAAVLKDGSEFRPDLAEHVLNLGARAMLGRSPLEFGGWLREKAQAMAAGDVPAELVQWIKDVLKLLEPTEQDIASWLINAVDFRFPLAVYLGTVSYFDSHVGTLVSYLKEQDIYDQSLIIVTAPHGETLQHPRLPYQHFLLSPETLRVPLIMKLPASNGIERGARLGGVFDLIDLFPTVMDIQSLPHPSRVSGVSRWPQIKTGKDIPPHESFAAGLHQLSHSLFRSPYLFVRTRSDKRMMTLHAAVNGTDDLLYPSGSDMPVTNDHPDLVESFRNSLDAWQISSGIVST